MIKDKQYYQQLFDKWLQSQSTPEEVTEMMDYLEDDSSNRLLLEKLQARFKALKEKDGIIEHEISERIKNELLKRIETPVINLDRKKNFRWMRVAAAIALIMVLSIATWLLVSKKNSGDNLAETTQPDTLQQTDVVAGTNKAVLTLANGKKIVLDSAATGKLADEGAAVVMNEGGQLVYNTGGSNKAEVLYNNLATARGESYQLVLADGTKVWLNAASSIRFPTAFDGNERKVEMTGEVYFEVAKDKTKPFRVQVNEMTVEVLGTHFNINSYSDEASINTTLVEGSVKVISKGDDLKLSPGQQSQLQSGGSILLIQNVNVDEIIAWKNGLFNFEHADIAVILRQFSRWYDIDVVIEGKLKPRKFFGIVKRSSSLANVLKLLEANDIHFRIEGEKLVVQSG